MKSYAPIHEALLHKDPMTEGSMPAYQLELVMQMVPRLLTTVLWYSEFTHYSFLEE